jgi:hypothetical protein
MHQGRHRACKCDRWETVASSPCTIECTGVIFSDVDAAIGKTDLSGPSRCGSCGGLSPAFLYLSTFLDGAVTAVFRAMSSAGSCLSLATRQLFASVSIIAGWLTPRPEGHLSSKPLDQCGGVRRFTFRLNQGRYGFATNKARCHESAQSVDRQDTIRPLTPWLSDADQDNPVSENRRQFGVTRVSQVGRSVMDRPGP